MAAIASLLAACGTPGAPDSPNYSAGFGDGCADASTEISSIPRPPKRNEALYAKDADYRSGWITGRATCRMEDGPPRL